MAIARSVPLQPHRGQLQASPHAPRRSLCPASARSRLLSFPRHRGPIVICAASDKDAPKQPESPSPLAKAARQLAGATALAAVALAALALRDRVTSPVVPPLLPRVVRLLPDGPSSTTRLATPAASARALPAAAASDVDASMHSDAPNSAAPSNTSTAPTAAVSQHNEAAAAAAAAPARRPVAASVLRAVAWPVWATATLPLRIMDMMLFPDADLIRPLPAATSPAEAVTRVAPSTPASSAADKSSTAAPAAAKLPSDRISNSLAAATAPSADAASAAAPVAAALQGAAAAQVWGLSVAHAAQDLLLQLQQPAAAPASPAAAAAQADVQQQLTSATPAGTSAGVGNAAAVGAAAETGITTPAAAAARQAEPKPVAAGLDVGSDAMTAETVAALRALFSSSGPLRQLFWMCGLVLSMIGLHASTTRLLVQQASRASGRSIESLFSEYPNLQLLPLSWYTWPNYHARSSSSSRSPAANTSSSSSSGGGGGGGMKRSARAKPNAGELLLQLPISCYSPPDVMHQLPEIACYQRQRSSSSSSSSSNGLAAADTSADGVTGTAECVAAPPAAAAVATTPVPPPASPAAAAASAAGPSAAATEQQLQLQPARLVASSAGLGGIIGSSSSSTTPAAAAAAEHDDDVEDNEQPEWCLSSARAYSLLGGPPKQPKGRQQQQQQQRPANPGSAASSSSSSAAGVVTVGAASYMEQQQSQETALAMQRLADQMHEMTAMLEQDTLKGAASSASSSSSHVLREDILDEGAASAAVASKRRLRSLQERQKLLQQRRIEAQQQQQQQQQDAAVLRLQRRFERMQQLQQQLTEVLSSQPTAGTADQAVAQAAGDSSMLDGQGLQQLLQDVSAATDAFQADVAELQLEMSRTDQQQQLGDGQQQQQQQQGEVQQLYAELSSWVRSHLPIPAALGADAEGKWQQESQVWRQQQQQFQQIQQQMEGQRLGQRGDADVAGGDADVAGGDADVAGAVGEDNALQLQVLAAVRAALRHKGVMLWQWRQRLQEHNPAFQPAAAAEDGDELANGGSCSSSNNNAASCGADAAAAAVTLESEQAVEEQRDQAAAEGMIGAAGIAAAGDAAADDAAPAAAGAVVLSSEQMDDERKEQAAALAGAAAAVSSAALSMQQLRDELSALLQREIEVNSGQPAAAVEGEQAWQLIQLAASNMLQAEKQLGLLDYWLDEEALTDQLQQTVQDVQRLGSEASDDSESWETLQRAVRSKEVGAAAEARWVEEWRRLQQQQQLLARAEPLLRVAGDAPQLQFVMDGAAAARAAMAADGIRWCQFGFEEALRDACSALDAKEGLLQQWGWQLQQHNAMFKPMDGASAAAAAAAAEEQQDSSSGSGSSSASTAMQQGFSTQASISGEASAVQHVQHLLLQQQQLGAELTSLLQHEVDAMWSLETAEQEVGGQRAWQLLQLVVSQKQLLPEQLQMLEDWLGCVALADHLQQQLKEVQQVTSDQGALWRLSSNFVDSYGERLKHAEVGAAAEAQWVEEWRRLQQQRQQLARVEPLLVTAVTAAGTGAGGLLCVRRALTSLYDDECSVGYRPGGVIEEELQTARDALSGREAALQRWGWRLQQHNPGFRPLDAASDGSSSSSSSSSGAVDEPQDPAAALGFRPLDVVVDGFDDQEYGDVASDDAERQGSDDAEQQAGSSSSSSSSMDDGCVRNSFNECAWDGGEDAEQQAGSSSSSSSMDDDCARNSYDECAWGGDEDIEQHAGSSSRSSSMDDDCARNSYDECAWDGDENAEQHASSSSSIDYGSVRNSHDDGGWGDNQGAEQHTGSSCGDDASAGGSAMQLLQFINGRAAEAVAAAAEAEQATAAAVAAAAAAAEAAATQAGGVTAGGSGSAAAAVGDAAVQKADVVSSVNYAGRRFISYRRAKKPQADASDPAAAAAGSDASVGDTAAASDAEASYASAYQAAFPAAFLEAFDAADAAGSADDADDVLSASSSSSSRQASGVANTTSSPATVDADAADTATSTSSSSEVAIDSSSSSSELLDELRTILGLQGASFTAQAYNAVAASTATATGSSGSSKGEVPHVVLMLCHALLQRGEESEGKLAAAVRCLAGSRHQQMLPVMLAGAMAGVFRPAEFSRTGSSPQLLLRVLSDALPAQSYLALQQQLLIRGLLQELDIPCTFEEEQQQQQQQASNSSNYTDPAVAGTAASSSSSSSSVDMSAAASDSFVEYGVYKPVRSSAQQQQQQQQDGKPKARTLSKSAARRQRKKALRRQRRQQEAMAASAAAWLDPKPFKAEQQQLQQDFGFSLPPLDATGCRSQPWGEVGQYNPVSWLNRNHPMFSNRSSGSGSVDASNWQQQQLQSIWDTSAGWRAGLDHTEWPEGNNSNEDLRAGAGPADDACADKQATRSAGEVAGGGQAAAAAAAAEDEQEERWQRMLSAEKQWVEFAGLADADDAAPAPAPAAALDDECAAAAAGGEVVDAAAAGEHAGGSSGAGEGGDEEAPLSLQQVEALQERVRRERRAGEQRRQAKVATARKGRVRTWDFGFPEQPDSMDDLCYESLRWRL